MVDQRLNSIMTYNEKSLSPEVEKLHDYLKNLQKQNGGHLNFHKRLNHLEEFLFWVKKFPTVGQTILQWAPGFRIWCWIQQGNNIWFLVGMTILAQPVYIALRTMQLETDQAKRNDLKFVILSVMTQIFRYSGFNSYAFLFFSHIKPDSLASIQIDFERVDHANLVTQRLMFVSTIVTRIYGITSVYCIIRYSIVPMVLSQNYSQLSVAIGFIATYLQFARNCEIKLMKAIQTRKIRVVISPHAAINGVCVIYLVIVYHLKPLVSGQISRNLTIGGYLMIALWLIYYWQVGFFIKTFKRNK